MERSINLPKIIPPEVALWKVTPAVESLAEGLCPLKLCHPPATKMYWLGEPSGSPVDKTLLYHILFLSQT